ncbi:MAG: S-methyl-5-thioribose-1-phosphate isomerase [Burkholderiales bacterium]|nr:S-methyl-5-thioribose-1-phosphate isomerase [Burkholderiales bacterium]
MVSAVETLRWGGDHVMFIDQRKLPHRVEYVRCRDAAEVADAIRSMVVRGAPAIGCAAAYGIALEALKGTRDFGAAFAALRASRPTAVNLYWALDRMQRLIDAQPPDLAAALVAEARAIHAEDLEINRAIGRHGEKYVPDGARILTYCNTGALATAGYGTALGVIRAARDAGKRISVLASETRPYLQGARLTAWELVQENIPVTLITDNMAGHFMRIGQVDLVIVGADRVAANGDVANKIGTYGLAVLAARHGIPFYVAVPVPTFDPAIESGEAIPIEERSADEVTGYGDVRWAPEGVKVEHPAFDVTPAELVTAIITDKGVIERPDKTKIARLLDR